ncbi:MAG: colicin E3/pyocin S6 family cytotoxin [Pseudomonadota bacterium]
MEPNAPLLPFLPSGAGALSDEQEDVRDKRDPVKQAQIDLNRLGLYEPPGGKGLNEKTDAAFVAALKNFQRQAGITASVSLDDDITPQLLQRAVENNNADSLFAGWYVWRTVGDGKVRGAHAAREGQVFSWDNPPDGGHPGEDYNCRCWAQKYVPGDPASRQRAIEVREKARARQKAKSTSGKLSIPPPPDPRLLQEAMTDPQDPFNKNLGGEIRGALRPGGGKGRSRGARLDQPKKAPERLKAFPDAEKVKKGKTKRRRWKDSKGRIYEWDKQHGEVEIYDKTGKKHLGAFDPRTGKQLKPSDPSRSIEK